MPSASFSAMVGGRPRFLVVFGLVAFGISSVFLLRVDLLVLLATKLTASLGRCCSERQQLILNPHLSLLVELHL